MLKLTDYPQLKLICWNRDPEGSVEEGEAFALYERNWRLVDVESLIPAERELIDRLTKIYGNGVMNV